MFSKILIKDAVIITMNDSNEVYDSGDILIENDTIKSVGQAIEEEVNDAKIISGKGKVVIPGLINVHNHAAMSLFRSYADDYPLMVWLEQKIFPAEANLTPEDVFWGASLALLEMIRGGTTTYVDMYFFMNQTAQACYESGMRAVLSQVFIGDNAVEGFNSLNDAKDFAESWQNSGNGRISTILGPHAPYTCSPDFLKKVLSKTEQSNTPIHIHLSESRHEVQQSLELHKKTPVALMQEIGLFTRDVLAAHCVHVTDEDIDILVDNQVGIAHNPGSNLKLGSGIAPLKKMLDKGARVGLGTDGAASNNNLYMFEEIRLASLLQKGVNEDPTFITAAEALGLATREAAAALKKDNLGVLSAGAKADIAILNFNQPHLQPHNNALANIVYSACATDVDTVIVDGRVLYEKGSFLTLDEENIYYEANRRAKRLRQ